MNSVFLKEKKIAKEFVNHRKNKKESIELKKSLSNLGLIVNNYLSELYRKESGQEYSNPEKIKPIFSNDDYEQDTYSRHEYKFSKFEVLVEESAHFDIIDVDFWNFKRGSLSVNISSNDERTLSEMAKNIEYIIKSSNQKNHTK